MAAGKKVEPHVATTIRALLDNGTPVPEIAKMVCLHDATIYRLRLNFDHGISPIVSDNRTAAVANARATGGK
jgi:transposase